MKLRKLTIHNIASIEDAEIDFQASPLAEADVFLISGKTGAGKSTILDCICLALFTSTPRMDLTLMEGKMNDNTDKINIDNPRQLLRRGTGEGFSRLLFTGNDGVDYEATWTASRAYNKPNGRLKKTLNWEIRNLSTGAVTKSSEENKAIISRALGVDFNQFCRTTMLAQGEFTRFLNSKDSEKAQILEKITGASQYALIGAKVFEIYSGKKTAADDARRRIADIRILTDAELTAINSRLYEIDARKKQLNIALSEMRASKDWLSQRDAIEAKIKATECEMADARKVVDSPEMVALRLTISQWSETSEARPALAAVESANRELDAIEQESASFPPRFAAILADRDNLKELRNAKEIKQNRLREFIENEAPNKSVYASAPLISELVEQISRQKDIWQSHEKEATRLAQSLTERLQPSFDKIAQECEATADTLKQELKQLTDGETALEALQINKLKSDCDRLTQQKNDANGALRALRMWVSEHARLESLKADIVRRDRILAEKRKQYSDAQTELTALRDRRDSLKAIYDNQKNTVDKWAVAMRSHLHVGDCCPVCMQKVTEIPHQEVINQLLQAAESAFNTADCEYERFVAGHNRLGAEIKVAGESLRRDRKSAEDSALLNSSACEVSMLTQAAFGADTTVKLSIDSDVVLKDMIADIEKKLAVLDCKLKDARASEAAVSAQRRKVDSIRTVLEKNRRQLEDISEKVAATKAAREKALSLAATASENITNAQNRLSALLNGSAYERTESGLTIINKEIAEKAAKYNSAVEQLRTLTSDLSACDKSLSEIKAGIETLVQLYAPLGDVKALRHTSYNESPGEAISQLRSQIQSSSDRRTLAINRKKDSDEILRAFFASQPDIDLNRLKELSMLSTLEIKKTSQRVSEAIGRVAECETILKQFHAQLDELLAHQPVELADTNPEEIIETLDATERQLRQLDETTGSLRQQLADNDTNMKLRADQIEAVNRLTDELAPWEKLNALIGDATGAKFRKIAQSYVLASLIHSANHYMASLSDRYQLKVEPGTFIISIEDAYQGYACRPCTTISGGESFLVSLALALALSDIGDRVASDTIFIDEGFGSLSSEFLRRAINTLRTLHSKVGRHVGIISHVDELREQIPVQISVNRDSHNSAATISIIG